MDSSSFRITVQDNGIGINSNILRSIGGDRNVTNKVDNEDSLLRHVVPDTLGFKGEALNSLCHVATVEIETRPKSFSPVGFIQTKRKILRGGKIVLEEHSLQERSFFGTTVHLVDLFFNTPVRRKSSKSHFKLVKNMLEKFALANPHIGFDLFSNFQAPDPVWAFSKTTSTRQAFAQLFGQSLSDTLVDTYTQNSHFEVSGLVSNAVFKSSHHQFVFVNGRYFNNSKKVETFINKEYRDKIESVAKGRSKGLYPAFVLSIRCPTTELDILWDPTKSTFEFKYWTMLFECLNDLCKEAVQLVSESVIPVISKSRGASRCSPRESIVKVDGEPAQIDKQCLSSARVIGQLDHKFILLLYNSKILCIDQHAAHERVRLESFQELISNDRFNNDIMSVSPTESRVALSQDHRDILNDLEGIIKSWGYIWHIDDLYIVTVLQVPAVFGLPLPADSLTFFLEFAKEIPMGLLKSIIPPMIRDRIVNRACKGAIKFGDELLIEQCQCLVHDLSKCTFPFQCAHGRPSIVPLFNLA